MPLKKEHAVGRGNHWLLVLTQFHLLNNFSSRPTGKPKAEGQKLICAKANVTKPETFFSVLEFQQRLGVGKLTGIFTRLFYKEKRSHFLKLPSYESTFASNLLHNKHAQLMAVNLPSK